MLGWPDHEYYYIHSNIIIQDVFFAPISKKFNRVIKSFNIRKKLNDSILITYMSITYNFPTSIKQTSCYMYRQLIKYKFENIPPSIIMLDYATQEQIEALLSLNYKTSNFTSSASEDSICKYLLHIMMITGYSLTG